MNTIDAIMIAESLITDAEQYISAWQHLIDTGIVWQLQGWFGRTAENLINAGLCSAAQ